MSYPGSMSRGTKPVVMKGTKATLERYLLDSFPIEKVWSEAASVARNYEEWHRGQVYDMASSIRSNVHPQKDAQSVAAKFINTFMYQLMKYEHTRPLFPHLHLPLDRRVFEKLRILNLPSLADFKEDFSVSPYSLPYLRHLCIQECLKKTVNEINECADAGFSLTSRIQLNFLWL